MEQKQKTLDLEKNQSKKYKPLTVISVGNGSKKYAGNFTKIEEKIIKSNIKGYSINLFSGRSDIGNVRVDFSCEEANMKMDVFHYFDLLDVVISNFIPELTLIIDAPYNLKYAEKYTKYANIQLYDNINLSDQFIIFANAKKTTLLFNLIEEKIKPKRIIIKSWNYYIPNGYHDIGSYLCYAGGYRKPTILMILERDYYNGTKTN